MSAPSPPRLHPLVKATAAKLRAAKQDNYGGLRPGQGGLGIRVSPKNLDRAITIMDAVVKELEARGHTMRPGREGLDSIAVIRGEDIHFELNERISRKRHWPTKEEKIQRQREIDRAVKERGEDPFIAALGNSGIPDWDFLPSNEFTLLIGFYGPIALKKTWKDGPSKKLEEMISDFVSEAERFSDPIKRERERMEEHKREYEARSQRAMEERQRALQHQADLQQIEQQAERWERAMRIRAYVAAVEARAQADGRADDVRGWCEWALEVADSIDPIAADDLPLLKN